MPRGAAPPPISPSIDQEPLGKVEIWVADPTVQGHPADTAVSRQYRFGGDQRIVLFLQREFLPQRVMFCGDSSRLLRVQKRCPQNFGQSFQRTDRKSTR